MSPISHPSSLAPLDAAWTSLRSVLSDGIVSRPHPALLAVHRGALRVYLSTSELFGRVPDVLSPWFDDSASCPRLILLGPLEPTELDAARNTGLAALLPEFPTASELLVAVEQSFEYSASHARSESRGRSLTRFEYELGEILEISRALTTERNIEKLLGLILEKSRFITGADAGSLYVVEGEAPDLARRQLRFKLTQNDSLEFDWSEFSMPISSRSMAGWVALEQQTVRIDDVYDLPVASPFGFDRSFDVRTGYRTRSMLCVPLASSRGEVIGVIQLINKKRNPKQRLRSAEDFEHKVIPFDDRSEQLLTTLAGQAGIALENALLYAEISGLFDGFVRASVDAIEARDPTTSGHSRRVAELTVKLAQTVERADVGPYRDVLWRPDELRELEYASLLHDFGKIGVREHVLVKAKKLYPDELQRVRLRLDYIVRSREAEILARKLRVLERGGPTAELLALDEELARQQLELDDAWETILAANEPTVLKAGDFQRIEELGRRSFVTLHGEPQPLLTPEEVVSLSVMRGSLSATELDEIRSHVSHTFRFLSRIPWGRTFAKVPSIAGAHHERLNATGYPNRLHADAIPLQAKIMSIADIFDALTASDRPYKRAVPVEKALDILGFEVRDGHVDGELVRLFSEARVWQGLSTG